MVKKTVQNKIGALNSEVVLLTEGNKGSILGFVVRSGRVDYG